MGYLQNHQELRVDAGNLEPGTKTVIAVTLNYDPGTKLAGELVIARYAHGDDYHDIIRDRLRELGAFIHAETGADVAYRPAVDSAPLLERDQAQLAGLGWVGKNTMLIHPDRGSYTFIAELLVDFDLVEKPVEVPNRCGSCSACIDACPTNAIVGPYVLDARRCISYLTIELRGPIPRHLRPMIGERIFGCDICQEVCPWNSKSEPTNDPAFQTRESYTALNPEALLKMTQEEFSSTFRKSAIKRTKRRGLLRNAAVVLGNTRSDSALDTLIQTLHHESESLVRGHAAWALGQFAGPRPRAALAEQLNRESEPYVLEEIRYALESK